MNTTHRIPLILMALVINGLGTSVQAQEPKMKYSTEIPARLASK